MTTWTELTSRGRRALAGLRVAVYGSGGSPYHHAALAAMWGADVLPLSGDEIRAGGLDDVHALVVPGGGARAMTGLLEPLGDEGADAMRRFVEAGGTYIGSCAGSFLPARVGASFWEENPVARRLCMVDARLVNADDSEWAGLTSPGVGTVVAAVDRPGHWLARGLPASFHLVHYNGPMFDVEWTGDEPRLGRAVGAVRFADRTADFTPGERFLGEATDVLYDEGVAAGAHTALAADVGDGLVVLYGSHPEFGLDAIQLGWSEGVRLFFNALSEVARRGGVAKASMKPAPESPANGASVPRDVDASFGEAADGFDALARRFAKLSCVPFERIARGVRHPAFLGRSPGDVWRDGCDAAAGAAAAAARQLRTWRDDGVVVPSPRRHETELWLSHEARADQDYGFLGLLPLLATIGGMLDAAEKAIDSDAPIEPLAHAYDGLDRNPYQLVASSYLSAAGLTASATLAVATIGVRIGLEPDRLMDVLLA